MAVQASAGASRLVILIGAGLAGSVLIKNNKLGEFLGDVSKVFSKHLEEGENSEGGGGTESALSLQVKRLTQELRSITTSPWSDLTIVNGGSNSGLSLTKYIIPAALVGALSYGYFKWRGYTFTDIMYVTRKSMNEALTGMGKQLEHVSAALSLTRKHMTQRLNNMNSKLDESVVITEMVKDQVEQVKDSVGRIIYEIKNVNKKMEGLGLKIDEVQDSQNFANQGIFLLIEWVHRLNVVSFDQHPELANSFKSWFLQARSLEKSPSFAAAIVASPGLKQLIGESFENPPPVKSVLETTIPVKKINTGEFKPPGGLGLLSNGVSRMRSASVVSRAGFRGFSDTPIF